MSTKTRDNRVNNWYHTRPRNFYPKAVKILGTPLFTANVKGGMAFWKPKRGLFYEHYLRDEDVKHCVPKPHHDYFYSSIKIYVPPDKLKSVLSISGSINYDGLKKLLTARCASLEANIATLYLGCKIASGEYSLSKVKKQDMYGSHIRGEASSYQEMKKEMRRIIQKNRKQYKKELKAPLYALAFSRC